MNTSDLSKKFCIQHEHEYQMAVKMVRDMKARYLEDLQNLRMTYKKFLLPDGTLDPEGQDRYDFMKTMVKETHDMLILERKILILKKDELRKRKLFSKN